MHLGTLSRQPSIRYSRWMPVQSGCEENPLLDGLRIEPTPGPTTLVIFGASGDLTQRKLLPALYQLSRGQRLPARFNVIGVARTPMSDDEFRDALQTSLKEFAGVEKPNEVSDALARSLMLHRRRDGRPRRCTSGFATGSAANRRRRRRAVLSGDSSDRLRHRHRATGGGRPDGAGDGRRAGGASSSRSRSAPTCRARASSTRLLHRHMDESQVFRIDHYLGKETVQNLLVFRFANGMFEPVWNRRYIDHVQITAAETVGVERRASYYEGAGALRDMVQNHLMQVLALVAMEPPIAFSAENVRDRKHDALSAIQPLLENGDDAAGRGERGCGNVVRAQYAAGWLSGSEVPGLS